MYFLLQRNPPLKVDDLFEDIRDGVMLLCLLEVLSGEKLVGCNDISILTSLQRVEPNCEKGVIIKSKDFNFAMKVIETISNKT